VRYELNALLRVAAAPVLIYGRENCALNTTGRVKLDAQKALFKGRQWICTFGPCEKHNNTECITYIYFNDKALSLTGCGGKQGCETSRPTHFLTNRPTDGGEVISLTLQPPSTPRNIPGSDFY
jgi:hypothetical protein